MHDCINIIAVWECPLSADNNSAISVASVVNLSLNTILKDCKTCYIDSGKVQSRLNVNVRVALPPYTVLCAAGVSRCAEEESSGVGRGLKVRGVTNKLAGFVFWKAP